MEYIKIFLASSLVKYHYERLEISDFIRALNDRYIKKGIYFKLFICEDESEMLSIIRKQDDYNKEIENSDYFYMFVFEEPGKYTLEEFEIALKSFKSNNKPQIYTYFYSTDNVETFCNEFMIKLDKELGHYYSVFSSLDSIKLHMIMEFLNDSRIGNRINVEFRNNVAMIDNVPLIPLKTIPAFINNSSLQEIIKELNELEKEFSELIIRYSNEPQNKMLLAEVSNNTKRRNEIERIIDEFNKKLFNIMKMTGDRKHKGSWRTHRAIQEIERGNFEGALLLLNDSQRSCELKAAEERIGLAKEIRDEALFDIDCYIAENLLRVTTLEITDFNGSNQLDIVNIHKQNFSLFLKYGRGEDAVINYLQYLLIHNQNKETVTIISEIEKSQAIINIRTKIIIQSIKSNALLSMNKLNEAEKSISSALEGIDSCDNGNEIGIKIDILLNYGKVKFAKNEYETAFEYFIKAYELMQLTIDNSRKGIDRLVEIGIMLGSLASDLNKRIDAYEYYSSAKEYIEKIEDLTVNEKILEIALYNNISVLAVQTKNLKMSEEYIELSMDAIIEIEKKYPSIFFIYHSMALSNMGMILCQKNDYNNAAKTLTELLSPLDYYLIAESETYEPFVAIAYHNLGVICALNGLLDSDLYFDKAEEIEKKLIVDNSIVFNAYLAITRITRVALGSEIIITDFENTVAMAKQLVDELSPAYDSYLGMAQYNTGVAYCRLNDKTNAIKFFKMALETYERIAAYTGSKNQNDSYSDIKNDILYALDILTNNNGHANGLGIWYMEIYNIWNGQITGMAIRQRCF